jgi:hypothetical protein
MYERPHLPLLPRALFLVRLAKHFSVASALVASSLLIGIVGYRATEHMPWVDAFLNACMIMGGMGPVGELRTNGGKIFAGLYALYCGLVLIVSIGVVAAPVVHRFFHHFHRGPEPEPEDE